MARIWSIGGGKGGTGKSFFTGNLGILLAKQGYKTLLIDLDLGTANLHTITGITHPEKSLSDFLQRRVSSIEDTILSTSTENLDLISGAMNNLDIANLAHEQKMKLIRNIGGLPYDYILLDLGAGTSFNTIDFFMISDTGIFITTPEPTSIENIYRLIRSVYFRKIRQSMKSQDFRLLLEDVKRKNSLVDVSHPDILFHMVKELQPGKADLLEKELQTLNFKLAVNQIRKHDNPNIGELICKIIERHLSLKISPIGNISFDDHVHNAVCKKIPFIDLYPYSQTSLDLRDCSVCLLSITERRSVAQNIFN